MLHLHVLGKEAIFARGMRLTVQGGSSLFPASLGIEGRVDGCRCYRYICSPFSSSFLAFLKVLHHVERSRFEGGEAALCGVCVACPAGTTTADAWTLLVAMPEATAGGDCRVERWDIYYKRTLKQKRCSIDDSQN